MVSHRKDVVQGTLDLLVLRIIASQPMPEGRWECRRVTRYVTGAGFSRESRLAHERFKTEVS